MGGFVYTEEICERFPGIRGAVIHAAGPANGASPPDLVAEFTAEQARVRSEIGDTPLSDLPSIAAWRRCFSAFGVKPTQYRNAAESLLRRLTKQGDIPSINALVDMANLVSIRHRVPVAVFDQSHVTGLTEVRFADGTESFTDLGSDTATAPEPGEVVFVDEASLVSARRWCWRQSAQSAAKNGTSEVLVTIEGQHDGAEDDVTAARESMMSLMADHLGPTRSQTALIGPSSPRFEFGDG